MWGGGQIWAKKRVYGGSVPFACLKIRYGKKGGLLGLSMTRHALIYSRWNHYLSGDWGARGFSTYPTLRTPEAVSCRGPFYLS